MTGTVRDVGDAVETSAQINIRERDINISANLIPNSLE